MTTARFAPLAAALPLLAACGSNPVSYSQPVGINLKVKSGDVGAASAINTDKAITTEAGNPYGAFISAANSALGGANPGRIEVSSMTLLLGGNSINVTALEQVFAGEVDVLFTMNTSNNTYNVGKVINPAGGAAVPMTVTWASSAVAAQDMPQLLSGSFKVVLRGTAASGFSSRNAEADLQVTSTFQAFK